MNQDNIGRIGNYYGGLHVCKNEGKFYWIIENYDTDFEEISEWEEISEELYELLLKHNLKENEQN